MEVEEGGAGYRGWWEKTAAGIEGGVSLEYQNHV